MAETRNNPFFYAIFCHSVQTLKIFLYLNLIRLKPMGSSSVAKTPPVEVVFWRWTLPWLLCSSLGWLNHCLRQWRTLRHYDIYGLTIVNSGIRLNLFLECNWFVICVRLSTAVLLVCLYVPVWLHWIQYMKGCFYGDWLFTEGGLLVCAYLTSLNSVFTRGSFHDDWLSIQGDVGLLNYSAWIFIMSFFSI